MTDRYLIDQEGKPILLAHNDMPNGLNLVFGGFVSRDSDEEIRLPRLRNSHRWFGYWDNQPSPVESLIEGLKNVISEQKYLPCISYSPSFPLRNFTTLSNNFRILVVFRERQSFSQFCAAVSPKDVLFTYYDRVMRDRGDVVSVCNVVFAWNFTTIELDNVVSSLQDHVSYPLRVYLPISCDAQAADHAQ